MKAEELKEIQQDSYEKWFERWYAKESIPQKLKQAAMEGYSGFNYAIHENLDDYIKRRMNDKRFVRKLKEKLPELDITRIEAEKYEIKIFNTTLTRWRDPKVNISWR